MHYVAFALIAAVCFSASQIFNKLLSKHSINDKNSLMAYFMLASFSFGFFLLPFMHLTFPSWAVIKLMITATALFLVGYYCFFTGIFDADASSFSPLFQMQAGLVGLLAFLFLGERFPWQNYVWLVVLIVGAILVSFDEHMSLKSFLKKGMLFILLMQFFHATSNIFVGLALKQQSAVTVLFWEDMLIGIAAFFFLLLKRPKLNYKPAQIVPMFFSTYIVGAGVIALFSAFAENLTISSVIGLLSAPIVFVASLIASRVYPQLLEHHPLKVYVVRGVGLLIILLGAYKIILG